MEKIFTGLDRANELGHRTFRDFLFALMAEKGFVWSGKVNKTTVKARVDFGRWLADCGCGGAGYVDPMDSVFMCTSCGNQAHGGDFLTVVFPKDRDAIEKELLARPVIPMPINEPTQAAMHARSILQGTPRSWTPGETVADLLMERRQAIVAKEKVA